MYFNEQKCLDQLKPIYQLLGRGSQFALISQTVLEISVQDSSQLSTAFLLRNETEALGEFKINIKDALKLDFSAALANVKKASAMLYSDSVQEAINNFYNESLSFIKKINPKVIGEFDANLALKFRFDAVRAFSKKQFHLFYPENTATKPFQINPKIELNNTVRNSKDIGLVLTEIEKLHDGIYVFIIDNGCSKSLHAAFKCTGSILVCDFTNETFKLDNISSIQDFDYNQITHVFYTLQLVTAYFSTEKLMDKSISISASILAKSDNSSMFGSDLAALEIEVLAKDNSVEIANVSDLIELSEDELKHHQYFEQQCINDIDFSFINQILTADDVLEYDAKNHKTLLNYSFDGIKMESYISLKPMLQSEYGTLGHLLHRLRTLNRENYIRILNVCSMNLVKKAYPDELKALKAALAASNFTKNLRLAYTENLGEATFLDNYVVRGDNAPFIYTTASVKSLSGYCFGSLPLTFETFEFVVNSSDIKNKCAFTGAVAKYAAIYLTTGIRDLLSIDSNIKLTDFWLHSDFPVRNSSLLINNPYSLRSNDRNITEHAFILFFAKKGINELINYPKLN